MMPPLPSVMGRRSQGVQGSVQVGRRCLDVMVFALPGARLRGQHTAAVDILEVAVRELMRVSSSMPGSFPGKVFSIVATSVIGRYSFACPIRRTPRLHSTI